MMRLRDATLCAAASNKVTHEDEQGKEAAETELQDLKREIVKLPQSKPMRECWRTVINDDDPELRSRCE